MLVHGSVLERRPPEELVDAARALCGEPWQGEGLAGAGMVLAPEMLWNACCGGWTPASRRSTAVPDEHLRRPR